jgi:hypothetical protein
MVGLGLIRSDKVLVCGALPRRRYDERMLQPIALIGLMDASFLGGDSCFYFDLLLFTLIQSDSPVIPGFPWRANGEDGTHGTNATTGPE